LRLLDDANVDLAHGEVPLTGGRVVRAKGSLRLRRTRIGDKPVPASHDDYETASRAARGKWKTLGTPQTALRACGS
jgi:hypothetical protein